MTVWMLATVLGSTLFAVCAAVGDLIAARFVVPRRFVWIAALAAASALPVITGLNSTAVPHRRASAAADGRETPRPHALARSTTAPTWPTTLETFDASGWEALGARARSIARRADRWLLTAWVLISLAMLTRWLVCLGILQRERRRWVVTHEFAEPIFVAPAIGPAVVGVLRPRIVVPSWFLDQGLVTRRLLLRHETEHVRARDTQVLFGAALLELLFPWNIPLRWMARRLRLAVEIDCDGRVIRAVGGPRRYGLALLDASERYATPVSSAGYVLAARLQIEARIHAMTTRRSPRPVTGTLLLAALGGCVVAVSGWLPSPPFASAEVHAAQHVVGPETAGVRAVREFIAAYNDPDTTRIMKYVAVAVAHDRADGLSSRSAAEGSPLAQAEQYIRSRRRFGELLLQRLVPKGQWRADYIVTERVSGRQLVGSIIASERRPEWIENFSLLYVPLGSSLDDPDLQRRLDPTPRDLEGWPRDEQARLRWPEEPRR